MGKRGRINKNSEKNRKTRKKKTEYWELKLEKTRKKIKELKKYVDKLSLMFKSKTQETAMKRFQKLNDKTEKSQYNKYYIWWK